MAQIADVPTLQPIAQPFTSSGEAARPGETVSRLGQEGEQISQVGMGIEQQLIDTQLQLSVKQGGNTLKQYQNIIHDELRRATTPEEVDAIHEKYQKEWPSILEPFEKDHRAARALNMHGEQEAAIMQDTVNVKKAEIITKSDMAANAELGQTKRHDAIAERLAGGDGAFARDEYELALRSSELHGTMLPAQVDKELQKFDSDVQLGAIQARSNDPDPSKRQDLIQQLKAGKGHLVEGLPEALRAETLTAVEKRDRELTNLAESQDVNTRFGGLLGYFQKNQTMFSDPESKLAATANPEVLKAIGAVTYDGKPDFVMGRKLRSFVEPLVADEKYQAEQKWKAAEKEISDAMAKHEFGQARQLLLKNMPLLPGRVSEELDRAITARGRRTDEDISNREDASEYLKIKRMDIEDPAAIEREITRTPNLKTSTRDRLIDWLDSQRNTVLKGGVAAGDKYLHSQIAPSKSLFELPGPKHEARSAEAQQALAGWVKEQNDLSRKGGGKPLTEAEIFEHAKEIAPSYRLTVAEELEDMKEQAENVKKVLSGAKNADKRVAGPQPTRTYNGYEYTKGSDGQWHKGRKVE